MMRLFLIFGILQAGCVDSGSGNRLKRQIVFKNVRRPLIEYTVPPEESTSCFAIELQGKKKKPCVFPFKYKGYVYKGCLTKNDPDGFLWCSTKVDSDGVHILGREFWGHCRSGCPIDLHGVTIAAVAALPKSGPQLAPFKTTGVSTAALDITGGRVDAAYTPDVVSSPDPAVASSFPLVQVPAATPVQTNEAEIPEGIKWFRSGLTGGTWSYNCDFYGNDIRHIRVTSSTCLRSCTTTSGCSHFAWKRGLCSLKSGNVNQNAAVATDVATICGFLPTHQGIAAILPAIVAPNPNAPAQAIINWLPDSSASSCDFRD